MFPWLTFFLDKVCEIILVSGEIQFQYFFFTDDMCELTHLKVYVVRERRLIITIYFQSWGDLLGLLYCSSSQRGRISPNYHLKLHTSISNLCIYPCNCDAVFSHYREFYFSECLIFSIICWLYIILPAFFKKKKKEKKFRIHPCKSNSFPISSCPTLPTKMLTPFLLGTIAANLTLFYRSASFEGKVSFLFCFRKAEAVKQEEMSAYNAFKACVPVAWSPNLYITLVRGIPGTRRLHRRTLEALRLGKCNRTVMRWNTPTVRGMLQQVVIVSRFQHGLV